MIGSANATIQGLGSLSQAHGTLNEEFCVLYKSNIGELLPALGVTGTKKKIKVSELVREKSVPSQDNSHRMPKPVRLICADLFGQKLKIFFNKKEDNRSWSLAIK